MDYLVHRQYEIHHEKTAILLLDYQVFPAEVDDLASKGGVGQNSAVLEDAEIGGAVRRGLDEESAGVAENGDDVSGKGLIQQLGELSENELYLGKFERRLKAPSALDDDLNPVLLVLVTFAKQGGRISLTEER
jgi:hypothetical protein